MSTNTNPDSPTSTLSSLTASSSTSAPRETFIGNKPSTVLFFIALCVGISIALLFLFFTFRYFVRSRFGLYIPVPIYRQNRFGAAAQYPDRQFTGPIQLFSPNYINDHPADQILMRARLHERQMMMPNVYRKRQLTKEEVEQLFPLKTYAKWLAGGKEDVQNRTDGVLVYEEQVNNEANNTMATSDNADTTVNNTLGDIEVIESTSSASPSPAELGESKKSVSKVMVESDITDLQTTRSSRNVENGTHEHDHNDDHEELHFSSGTCVICLEDFEDDDQVRGLLCGHCFHNDCIENWLINRRASCPLCKRDYYMKDSTDGFNEMINNVFGQNLAEHVLYPRSTRFRATALLAAIQDIRSGNYNLHLENESGEQIREPIDPESFMYHEELPENYPPVPELPNLETLDPEILDIVNRRRFNVEDLRDLDIIAHKKAVEMTPWGSKFFWMLMGVSRIDIYFYYVLLEFQDRKFSRMAGNAIENATAENEQNNLSRRNAGHYSSGSEDTEERRSHVEVLV